MNAPPEDRVLPASDKLEACVLGSMLLDPACIPKVRHILDGSGKEAFWNTPHKEIFLMCCKLHDEKGTVDLVLLAEMLEKHDLLNRVGGLENLTRILETVPSAANAEHYATEMVELLHLRNIIQICQRSTKLAFDRRSSREIMATLSRLVLQLLGTHSKDHPEKIGAILQRVLDAAHEQLKRKAEGEDAIPGVHTGFQHLGDILGKLRNGELIVIAGHPSNGKTTLAQNIVLNVVRPEAEGGQGKNAFFFSLEKSKDDVGRDVYSQTTGITTWQWNTLTFAEGHMAQLGESLLKHVDCGLWVDAPSELSAMDVRAKVLDAGEKMDLVVIDYLQLMTHPDEERDELRIGHTTRSLKKLAKDFDIPVILISQLSRDAAKEARPPQLRDLRGSGSIEQDADVVLMMDRPLLRADTDKQIKAILKDYAWSQEDLQAKSRVWVKKHRRGETGFVDMVFKGQTLTLEDLPSEQKHLEF